MKRDMNELEADPPGLPPYITRSTVPPLRASQDPGIMDLVNTFAKFDRSFDAVLGAPRNEKK
jgi:hypothetical protein